MSIAIPLALVLCTTASTGDLQLEETLIATIPEGIELEGEARIGPDGNEWPNVSYVYWSADGRRVAYVGMQDGGSYPVIGEEVLAGYQFVDPPVFSDDGQHVAFRVGNRKSSKQERWWVLLDGETQGAEDWIGTIQFRPGTDELCYWTQPGARIGSMGEYTGGDLVFRAGKKKGKKWDDANALIPVSFSADGSVIASPAMRKSKWYAMRFEKKGERKPKKKEGTQMITSLALSPDGKDVALCTMDPRATGSGMSDLPPGMPASAGMFGMKLIVMHGKEVYGQDQSGAGQPVFSPDSKRLAYKLLSGDKMGIAIDGKPPATASDYVHTPVWSPDSKRIAYAVTEGGMVNEFWRLGFEGDYSISGGQTHLYFHDRGGKNATEGSSYLEVRDIVWGPDDDQIAYRARTDDGWIIVCGDKQSPVFDQVGTPTFGPQGAAVYFGARTERELWWRVLEL